MSHIMSLMHIMYLISAGAQSEPFPPSCVPLLFVKAETVSAHPSIHDDGKQYAATQAGSEFAGSRTWPA